MNTRTRLDCWRWRGYSACTGKPDDIANTVAFLCSKDGGWVNGQVLRANGGFA